MSHTLCQEFSVFHLCAHYECLISAIHQPVLTQLLSPWLMCNDENCVSVESPLVSGGGPLSDLSPSLLHGPDSGQPFLCGPQSSGET